MEKEFVYEIRLEYKEYSAHPAQVFHAMGELIELMKKLDDALIDSLPYQISNKIILESVATGSIIAKLHTVLENIDDEALKELNIKKVIGAFLVKGKHELLKLLSEKEGIETTDDFDMITSSIEEVGNKELKEIGIEPNISKEKLLEALNTMSELIKRLGEEEKAIYISSEGAVVINKDFSLSKEKIEELLTEKTTSSITKEIVTVKKPDYLGTSKWELYFPQFLKCQFVKIEDKKWLGRFQSGDIDLRPGDSVEATIESRAHIDEYSREIAVEYKAITIHKVINNHRDGNQVSFFES